MRVPDLSRVLFRTHLPFTSRKEHRRKLFEAACKCRPSCKVISVCVTFTFAVKRNVSFFYGFSWFKMRLNRPIKYKYKAHAARRCMCTGLETETELNGSGKVFWL